MRTMKQLNAAPSLRVTQFTMEAIMTTKQRVSIKLTAEQQKQLQQATGQKAEAIELGVEELEERIAPSYLSGAMADRLADPLPSPVFGGGDWVILK